MEDVSVIDDGEPKSKKIRIDSDEGESSTLIDENERAEKNDGKEKCSIRENDVGITEYIHACNGFTAIIKQRYSDFLVNEVDERGNLVRLTDIGAPQCDVQEEDESVNPALTEVFTDDQLQQLKQIETSKTGDVWIQVGDDKEKRTKLHSIIRENFDNLESTTTDKDGNKFIKVTYACESKDRVNKKGRDRKRKPAWPKGKPDYCEFVMYKENKDTPDAVNLLAKILRTNAGQFTYAGTKDRRSKSTQLITVFRVSATRLHQLNKPLNNIALGNFRYTKTPLKLGMLIGNHFTIVLRNVTGTDEQINNGVSTLQSTGFINYFGMQRFGTSIIPTHHIGRAILQQKWTEVVDLILQPRDDFIAKARQIWKDTGDANKALEHLGRKTCIERHLLMGLSKCNKNDIVGALNYIPRNSRHMYLHSYQSYIWNSMVSIRIQKYGLEPVIGDLVLSDSAADDPSDGDSKVEPDIVKEANIDSYTIYDVVLPLPGYDVCMPQCDLTKAYTELLEKDGLTVNSFKHKVKDYSMPGGYRKVLVKPTNVSHEILRYDDYTVPLVLSDYDNLKGNTEASAITEGKMKAVKLELTLPRSAYATMAIREVLKCDTTAAHQITLNVT